MLTGGVFGSDTGTKRFVFRKFREAAAFGFGHCVDVTAEPADAGSRAGSGSRGSHSPVRAGNYRDAADRGTDCQHDDPIECSG